MANSLNDLTLSGTTRLASGGKFTFLGVGQPISAANHVSAAGEAYFNAAAEFNGPIYLRDTEYVPVAHKVQMQTSAANAWRVVHSGASLVTYAKADTNSERFEHGVLLQLTSGWINHAAGTNSTKQPETFKMALSADSGEAGMLAVTNPLGANALVKDAIVNITQSGSGYFRLGVATSAASSGNLIGGTSGCLSNTSALDNIDNQGTSGGYGILIGAAQRITMTCHSGVPSGAGLASGHVYITLQPR